MQSGLCAPDTVARVVNFSAKRSSLLLCQREFFGNSAIASRVVGRWQEDARVVQSEEIQECSRNRLGMAQRDGLIVHFHQLSATRLLDRLLLGTVWLH